MAGYQHQKDFYYKFLPYAERAAIQMGPHVNPHWILGQLALETNWGKSVLPGTHNYGNIMEVRKNVAGVHANDNGNYRKFRKFASDQDFFDHYVGLMGRRYKGVANAQTAEQFGRALKAGGYAEDPKYVNSIVAMNNAVNRVSGGNYVWNGKVTTNEPIPAAAVATTNTPNGTSSVSGAGTGTVTLGGEQAAPTQVRPSVLGQPMDLDGGYTRPRYTPGNVGGETLTRLFGGKTGYDFWRT